MRRLFIAGAGGFGREVHAWASDALQFGAGAWSFGGFLDDNPAALDKFADAAPGWRVVGPVAGWRPQPGDAVVVAVGSPRIKRTLVEMLRGAGASFATVVHPSVVVGPRVRLGEGCILCPRVVLTCDIELGSWVSLNVATAVGHDVRVDDFCQTSSLCDLTGGVCLEEGAFLGSRATILPRQRVGAWSVVGAGSVVVRSVRPGTTVFGSPAKELPRN